MNRLEAVRRRPGMYVGDVHDGSGFHHLLFEVVNNSLAEAWAGHCDSVDIDRNADGSAAVRDNGRGIPTQTWHNATVPEIIMTKLHSGSTFDRAIGEAPAELRGVGVAVVNALSERLDVRIWREGKEHVIRFRRGVLETPLEVVGPTQERGTEVTFAPDPEIFGSLRFDVDRIEGRMRALAHLNLGVTLSICDRRTATAMRMNLRV